MIDFVQTYLRERWEEMCLKESGPISATETALILSALKGTPGAVERLQNFQPPELKA